jgi:circadian clock protein KaiC
MKSVFSKLCSTGMDGLDQILGGGLPRNRLYLLQGEPGAGKTTLAMRFLLDGAAKGESGLYVTLSETKDELLSVAESHGWDLSAITILELSAIEAQLGEAQENTFFHPSELELDKTAKLVTDEVERVKPMRMAIDSLSEFRLLAEVPLRYRRQLLKLKQFFAGRHTTVLLLDDQSADKSDLHVQSIAHGVITLCALPATVGGQQRQLQINKLRGVKFSEGFHDYSIVKGGLEVFPRLVASKHHRDFEQDPVSSGIPEFDKLLGGGLDRGTSNLFIGPAGTGKSTLAIHHAIFAADRGEKAVVFAFDENIQVINTRTSGLGLALDKHLKSGRIRIQQIDPAELSPGEFATAAVRAVEKDNARVVVIDSLNGYLNGMPDGKFLALQLHELLTYLSQQGVVSILTVAQHGLVGVMQSPVDVTYLADTVILLRYFEAGGRVKKAVSVMKKRSGSHENTIREFAAGPKGIKIGEPLEDFHGILTGVPVFHGEKEMLKVQ